MWCFEFCNSRIVSLLASRDKLRAIVPDLANRPRQLVFLTPIDSQLNDFLNEIHQIVRMEPSIVEQIDEDLDLHAKKKKLLLRLADERFLAGQTPGSITLSGLMPESGEGTTLTQPAARDF